MLMLMFLSAIPSSLASLALMLMFLSAIPSSLASLASLPDTILLCTPCVHGSRIGDACLGACRCNALFTGDDCNSCKDNRLGNACQYSDATTCFNHGTVDSAGACACHHGYKTGGSCDSCAVGFVGTLCQFSNMETCHGNGVVNAKGACMCSGNWGRNDCSVCKSTDFKGLDCEFSANVTCHNHGQVSESGVCTCDAHFGGGLTGDTKKDPFCEQCTPPWVGDTCQFSDATTCQGNGAVDIVGNCHCHAQWSGNANCTICSPGFAGLHNNCGFSDAKDCSNHGAVDGSGRCTCTPALKWAGDHCHVCQAPWKGQECQYSDAQDCSNHGTVDGNGRCSCRHHWSGVQCEVCAQVGAAVNGTDCQYSDLNQCNGHGSVQMEGACSCRNHWSGKACEVCPVGHAGKDCEFSDRVQCSAHGVVHASSKCTCRNDWSGEGCNVCSVGHAGKDCQFSDAVDCHSNGSVNQDGSCQCFDNWNGNSVCTLCTNRNAKGKNCKYTRKETCHGHGSPVSVTQHGFPSLCKCDANYWGANCRLTEREFQLSCVALPSRNANKCCGSTVWPVYAAEEERRITEFDMQMRSGLQRVAACDSVWGVWRGTDATAVTGVPRFSGEMTADGWVSEKEMGGGDGGDGSDWTNFNHYDVHYYK